MSMLTDRELEFLASLRKGGRRLYWSELARLVQENDNSRDARREFPSIAAQSGRSKGFIPS